MRAPSRQHARLTLSYLLVGLACVASACSSPETPDGPDGEQETQCQVASEQLGKLACVHRIDGDATWQSVSVPLEAVDQVRAAKYMYPLRADARLAPVILNSNQFELHYQFLAQAFPELFPNLTGPRYLDLLFHPEQREYLVGSITEYRTKEGATEFGITIASDPSQAEILTCADLSTVYDGLVPRMPGKTQFEAPSDNRQLAWFPSCDVPVRNPGESVEYEPYHTAVGFGTVRRYNPAQLEQAIEDAAFGFQDILVLAEAPLDLERVISGAITGTRQGPLSHLAVRSASRGTPNCYLRNAYEFMARYDGKLVRAECKRDTLLVREATLVEAQAFWDKLKPAPVKIPAPDLTYQELVTLETLPVADPAARALAVRRFGAKGTNLAWLRQNLTPELTPPGFVVPMFFYDSYLAATRWQVDLGAGAGAHTLKETLTAWLKDPKFLQDAKLRRERLLGLQEAFEAGTCDPLAIEALATKIESVFGSDLEMVRLRSSSNAEDGALFNGAGLYDSYSGCLADDRDADETGPSRCDASKKEEKGLCTALKKVWASLWNLKAFEERAFYGIDQLQTTMAVLVNERSEAELANMVAFTGNPVQKGDPRYLINAQVEEIPVVSPDPGIWPEQTLLTIKDGAVTTITRSGASSELPEGEQVLSDAQLKVLGAHLAELASKYPVDSPAPTGRSFILDTEWKVMPGGALRIKQIRPFLK